MLSASTHAMEKREENDYYATEPRAIELLLELEQFKPNILEPMCGEGHISEVLRKAGYNVTSSDLIDRGYGKVIDVFSYNLIKDCDIISNPPYKMAQQVIEHLLNISVEGTKIAMFMRTLFLESKARKKMFEQYPPKTVWVSSSRLRTAKNGEFERYKATAVSYSWFVWEKGYKGNTTVKWFN